MSAAEVIESIKKLPAQERAEVARYLEEMETSKTPQIRYADQERAREVSARIFESHGELFRKLAE